jgi:hypothetical protein
MEIININGYGVIEVENQEVLNILNKFPQEDLVIFGKLGYKYIDVEDSMRFSSIIYDYYTQQETRENPDDIDHHYNYRNDYKPEYPPTPKPSPMIHNPGYYPEPSNYPKRVKQQPQYVQQHQQQQQPKQDDINIFR